MHKHGYRQQGEHLPPRRDLMRHRQRIQRRVTHRLTVHLPLVVERRWVILFPVNQNVLLRVSGGCGTEIGGNRINEWRSQPILPTRTLD